MSFDPTAKGFKRPLSWKKLPRQSKVALCDGVTYKVPHILNQDPVEDCHDVWKNWKSTDLTEVWDRTSPEEMERINNKILNNQTYSDKEAVNFFRELLLAFTLTAQRDLNLTPKWKIKKGEKFGPASLFNIIIDGETNWTPEMSEAVGVLLIRFRISWSDHRTYTDQLVLKGKEALNVKQTCIAFKDTTRDLIRPYMAALDWYLQFQNLPQNLTLRFGTVPTCNFNMAALRSYYKVREMTTEGFNLFEWIYVREVCEDFDKVSAIPKPAYAPESVLPYISSLNKVRKNDLSASALPHLHNYINCILCLSGLPRGTNAIYQPNGNPRILLNAAFCAHGVLGGTMGIQVAQIKSKQEHAMLVEHCKNVRQLGVKKCFKRAVEDDWASVRKWLNNQSQTRGTVRDNSVGKYVVKNGRNYPEGENRNIDTTAVSSESEEESGVSSGSDIDDTITSYTSKADGKRKSKRRKGEKSKRKRNKSPDYQAESPLPSGSGGHVEKE